MRSGGSRPARHRFTIERQTSSLSPPFALLLDGENPMNKLQCRALCAMLCLSVAACSPPGGANADHPLQGVWEVEKILSVEDGADPVTIPGSQPNLFIFTKRYFSGMSVFPVNEPRPMPSNDDGYSDEEIIKAFATLVAHTGTYETSGSTVKYQDVLSIQGRTASTASEYEIDGDTLILSRGSGENSIRITLRRLE